MSSAFILSFVAFAALLPAAAYGAVRREPAGDGLFWLLGLAALVGLGGAFAGRMEHDWASGFVPSLWGSTLVTLFCYLATCLVARPMPRLAGLAFPYLAVMGALILAFSGGVGLRGESSPVITPWLGLHIVASLVTYSLVTLAALLGLSVLLRERAMKRKRASPWLEGLPPIVEAERLELVLLGTAELVLGLGIVSGMGLLFAATGSLFALDHKTLFSVLAFIAIAVLLILRQRSGLRGRVVSRIVLAAFLLLTLGFLGVKFVTDVLLA